MRKILLLILLLMVADAKAQSLITPQVNNCGMWNKVSMDDKTEARAWVVGFISGLNSVAPKNTSEYVDVLKNIDGATVESAVDLYCRNNLYKTLQEASYKIYFDLKKMARQR